VSATRIQQLLAPLQDAGRVTFEDDPDNPRRKLWRLKTA